MQALWEEHQPDLLDRFYSDMLQDEDLKRSRLLQVDMELAARLQQDWNREDALPAATSIMQIEEQARLDADLARCVEQLDDGTAHAVLDQHGREVEKTTCAMEDVAAVASSASASAEEMPAGMDGRMLEMGENKMCCACTEEFPDSKLATLKCQHQMCSACLRQLVRVAMSDVSLIPIKCCNILLCEDLMREVLDSAEFVHFLRMSEEKRARNKMFCTNPACSQLINLDKFAGIEGSGELDCPACTQKLCIKCKSTWHAGQTCAQRQSSAEEAQLDEIAAQMGWKRCPKCIVYVNLRVGCNHMTCLCGHEFCFACLESWVGGKTCDCPLWDERNLIEEGNRREQVEQERLGRQLFAHERQVLQRQLVIDNREARECRHHPEGFTFREFARAKTKGGGLRTCDNCENFITAFCYECDGCRMKFCHTCRFNRKLT